MKTVTYIGPAGERVFDVTDGFTVPLRFRRGEPLEISNENLAHLMDGPHAREFIEGEPDEPLTPPDAGVAAGALTDTTGDEAPKAAADDKEA